MHIHVCGIEGCTVRDLARLAGVRHLWGRDTGCVLKPLATLFSFDTDQLRHTVTKLIARSADPQDASKVRAYIGRHQTRSKPSHKHVFSPQHALNGASCSSLTEVYPSERTRIYRRLRTERAELARHHSIPDTPPSIQTL